MDDNNTSLRIDKLLRHMLCVPRQMTNVHEVYSAHEFLIHHVADKHCFNVSKAAYFIDNPDFDIVCGMAGFHQNESYSGNNHWNEPEDFMRHMGICSFNKAVKNITLPSIARNKKDVVDFVKDISDELSIESPLYISVPVKHQNNGLLIFETNNIQEHRQLEEYIVAGAHFFSLCPVFKS